LNIAKNIESAWIIFQRHMIFQFLLFLS